MTRAGVAIVREALRAFAARDMDAVADLLTEDVAWHTPGHHRLAGTYRGREQVLEYLHEALRLSTDTMRLDPVDFLSGRNHVAVVVDVTGERRGRRLRDRSIQLFRLRGAMIAERRVYPADQDATDAFWAD